MVGLFGNIELPTDIAQVKAAGAGGIGLYRTEFLFMGRESLPDEERTVRGLPQGHQGMAGKPVTITLDIGAIKALETSIPGSGLIPRWACRAIHFPLEPQIFLAQLRALLRASHYNSSNCWCRC